MTEILAAERQERSWENAPGTVWCRPAMADRGREIGDLGMAGLNIGAPARLQRGGRALLPAGASTPLGGSSGELPRTYSVSSARVDYRRRLEMNTQDRDEDVLFRQGMRYPERGAGGFSGPRRAGAGESRASPPVQQLDVSEYLTASEAGSERGRSRHQGHPEDRPSASREKIGRNIDQEDQEPAGCREEDPDPPASAGHHFRGSRPWAAWRLTGHPCRRGTVQVHPCLPGDHRACHFPDAARACSSPAQIATIRLREATAEPRQGSLGQATGRGSLPHR
jgi:hypothetical protein